MRNATKPDRSDDLPSELTTLETQRRERRTEALAVALSCIEFLFQKAGRGSNKAEELLAGCARDLQALAGMQAANDTQN